MTAGTPESLPERDSERAAGSRAAGSPVRRGSTRRWRKLRAYVLTRDASRCQVPVELVAAGGYADHHPRPGSWAWFAFQLEPAPLICAAYAEHVDHVIPVSKGGTDDPTNLRAACAFHNLQLGNSGRLPDQRPVRRRWEW